MLVNETRPKMKTKKCVLQFFERVGRQANWSDSFRMKRIVFTFWGESDFRPPHTFGVLRKPILFPKVYGGSPFGMLVERYHPFRVVSVA